VAATSDGGGRFSLNLPEGLPFSLSASANGYQQSQSRQPAASPNSAPLEIQLQHLLEMRGRVISEDTRMPIPGLSFEVLRADLPTVGIVGESIGSKVAADGSFSLGQLTPGAYLLRFAAAPATVLEEIPAKDLEGENREKALQVPDPVEGYGVVVWPGENADITVASAVKLDTSMDLGEIRLRRYKLHNLSGVLTGCAEGTYLQLLLLQKRAAGKQRLADLDTKCGAGFRILNLPDGTFTLLAQGGPPRMFVSETITGATRGPVFLNVSSVVSVQIRVEVEDAPTGTFPSDFPRLSMALTPENVPVNIDTPDRVSASEYEAHLFGNERYRLTIPPLGNYYLKKVFYNGVASEDLNHFTAVSASLSTLRLVVSNRPGSVEVQAPPRASVYLVREGIRFADFDGADKRMFQQTAEQGTLRFTGLAPGKYRAFALDGPLVFSQTGFEAALQHSTPVTLEEGQTSSISVALP
jgi:hypothetical protein